MPDCCIHVTYKAEPQTIVLTCPGLPAQNIVFCPDDGDICIHKTGQVEIDFVLSSSSDLNDGLAGIKIWAAGEPKPAQGMKEGTVGPFTVTAETTEGKTLRLKLFDAAGERGAWSFAVGVSAPFYDDPKIYNDGDPPSGGGGRRSKAVVHKRSARRRSSR